MNKLLLLFTLFFFVQTISGQDCNNAYIPFQKGMMLEYENLNRKGKVESKDEMTIQDIETTAEGIVYEVKSVIYDDKGKEIHNGIMNIICNDGVYVIDMESLVMNNEMMESMKNMDVTIESAEITVPSSLTVGQKLDGGTTTIEVGSGGMQMMSMDVAITNRRVTGKETVTVPAGTYDTYVIEYDTEVDMMGKRTSHTKEYWAKDIGIVKSEFYNKKDKLGGTRQLTAFKP